MIKQIIGANLHAVSNSNVSNYYIKFTFFLIKDTKNLFKKTTRCIKKTTDIWLPWKQDSRVNRWYFCTLSFSLSTTLSCRSLWWKRYVTRMCRMVHCVMMGIISPKTALLKRYTIHLFYTFIFLPVGWRSIACES